MKFCYWSENENFGIVEERKGKFRKIEEKCKIWVDLRVTKKTVALYWLFIFRTDGAICLWGFVICQKIKISAVEERNEKLRKNWRKMRYFGRFVCDKENSSSSLMIYFQNWWSYESLKFHFCRKIDILAKLKRRMKNCGKLEKNAIFQ